MLTDSRGYTIAKFKVTAKMKRAIKALFTKINYMAGVIMSLTKKEVAFNFFKRNLHVLHDSDIKKYLNLLGIKESTYIKYRYEYMSIAIADICTKINFECNDKCIKKREKFIFDDSKLFEIGSR